MPPNDFVTELQTGEEELPELVSDCCCAPIDEESAMCTECHESCEAITPKEYDNPDR